MADGPDVVDLKTAFAFPLPMSVIGELFGVDPGQHQLLRGLYEKLFSSVLAPQDVLSTIGALRTFYASPA